MKVKLALAQINTRLGVVEKNLETHLAQIKKAVEEGSDLIIFPGTFADRICAAGPGIRGGAQAITEMIRYLRNC